MTEINIQDLLHELESAKAERNKLRLERHQLRKTVDALTQEVKDLRKLNTSYLQLLSDKPVKTGTLRETVKLQAQQNEQLEQALQMERLQKQYAKTEPKPETEPEPVPQFKTRRGRPALTSASKEEIRNLYREGKTVREIRDKIGVSLGVISKVLNEQK